MFSYMQDKDESVASLGSRIDERQTNLWEAPRCACKPEWTQGEVVGKAYFTQGLYNEWIQTLVQSGGESILLPQANEF